MFYRKFFALGALTILFVSTSASAEIYKWTDANGVTQFGERPPQNIEREEVRVRHGGTDQGAIDRLAELQDTSREASEARKKAKEEKLKLAGLKRANQEKCKQAKAHRQRLVSANRLFVVNAQGERERVGEKARSDDMARVDKAIKDLCS